MKIWKGKYGFSEEHGDVLSTKTIQFELHIDINDGGFSGRFIDPEYAKICENEIKVNGFFEDDFISFVVTYPFRKLYNLEGEPLLQQDKIDQEVTYYGEFIDDSQTELSIEQPGKKISGQWEILEQAYFDVDRINVIYSNGSFELEESLS